MKALGDRGAAGAWDLIVAISDWHRGKLIETFELV
jgi:hypothetical protein